MSEEQVLKKWSTGDKAVIWNRSPVDGDRVTIVDPKASDPEAKWIRIDVSENYPDDKNPHYSPLQHKNGMITPAEWEVIFGQFKVGDPIFGKPTGQRWQDVLLGQPRYLGVAVDVSQKAYIGVKQNPDDPDEEVVWTMRYDARHGAEEQLIEMVKGIPE